MKNMHLTAAALFCTISFASIGKADVDVSLFLEGALADEVTTENCTLSDG